VIREGKSSIALPARRTRRASRQTHSCSCWSASGGDESDRFTWYCAKCGTQLHQSVKQVADYREDPVSRAYEEFYGSEAIDLQPLWPPSLPPASESLIPERPPEAGLSVASGSGGLRAFSWWPRS